MSFAGRRAERWRASEERLAGQLVRHRRARGWTQAEVAKRAGISREYLARLEAGRHLPSLRVLEGLAAALDLTIGALVD
jgi:transcriptional regulator with XRE-family HTH domain